MAKKQDFDKDIHLSSFDDLFQTDESREDMKREKLMDIPISKIQDFPEHPYKVKDDENMVELVESVKTRGLIQPVLVRPLDNGMYEMVSGHRRKRAFEIAGIEKIPARVQNLTKDEAILSMVDSNLQRDEILPSEKAFAFKMRLEAMKRIGGRPSKENGAPVEHPYLGQKSRDVLAEEVGEIAPQFVHWRPANEDDAPEAISSNGLVAEGVMYERLVVPLIHHIQKLTERVDELESELKLLLTSRSDIR